MGQVVRQYRGCIGHREDALSDRVAVRSASWGPRFVWQRTLAGIGKYWRHAFFLLSACSLVGWGLGRLMAGEPGLPDGSPVAMDAEVPVEDILENGGLSTVLDPIRLTPQDEMEAALFRSDLGAGALARRYYIESTDTEVQESALMVIAEVARREWPDDYRGQFLASLLPAVLRTARRYRIPPSVSLGQAVLESGWGRSGLSIQHYNFFGVKAGSSRQRVEVPTWEYSGTTLFMTRANFRTYSSQAASIEDHARILGLESRYEHARPYWDDWRTFLEEIAPVYASSPRYAIGVTDLIETYGLDAWDSMVVEAAERDL